MWSCSYRVPVLYFSVHNLPPGRSCSIESVYDLLMPKHLEAEAKIVGVMGGIGMTVSKTELSHARIVLVRLGPER